MGRGREWGRGGEGELVMGIYNVEEGGGGGGGGGCREEGEGKTSKLDHYSRYNRPD